MKNQTQTLHLKRTHFVKKLSKDSYKLEDNGAILTKDEFVKLQKLVLHETGLIHMWIIFCDYSKPD